MGAQESECPSFWAASMDREMRMDTSHGYILPPFPVKDSHMHLDRTARKLLVRTSESSLDDVPKVRLPVFPVNPIRMIGAVDVYCDLHNFPVFFSS